MNWMAILKVVARVGAQNPQAGAVVDGGVLVVLLGTPSLPQGLDELHVHLQLVAGCCFS
jgi:hypothetical protein